MNEVSKRIRICALGVASFFVLAGAMLSTQSNQEGAAPGAGTRRIGAVKAVNGTVITLTPDSGSDLKVTVQPATRIVRIAPGEKDLKNATPIELQRVQVDDRVLVGGRCLTITQRWSRHRL